MPVFDFIRNSDGAKGSKRLVEVNVASIHPNPYQPRATFDEESIAELAQSIQQVGLLQPLLVRKVDDGYELVAGERRLRAVTSLGMEKVACIVQQDIEDESSAMMALIENLQREDLHYLEEAQCYQKLLETYGLTQEELANRLGKSQSSIANKLRLLKLSDEVKAAMTEKRLSERHARALLKLTDDKQRLDAVEKIAEKGFLPLPPAHAELPPFCQYSLPLRSTPPRWRNPCRRQAWGRSRARKCAPLWYDRPAHG